MNVSKSELWLFGNGMACLGFLIAYSLMHYITHYGPSIHYGSIVVIGIFGLWLSCLLIITRNKS